ncbi:unnamed protein product [Prorocentrum cordatum]|uniref:Pre-mRNA-splicing factor 38 n=1 Tax=Prorocentrum cordatum TaxID=2364126 RepID=A0ABN9W140_9DINO|nr:unnamed protein product [Polarella glacialis]
MYSSLLPPPFSLAPPPAVLHREGFIGLRGDTLLLLDGKPVEETIWAPTSEAPSCSHPQEDPASKVQKSKEAVGKLMNHMQAKVAPQASISQRRDSSGRRRWSPRKPKSEPDDDGYNAGDGDGLRRRTSPTSSAAARRRRRATND